MVQELLEKPIGEIFNKYKTKWFGTDGNFKGFNAVEGSLTNFANELNALVTGFSEGMESLPDELKISYWVMLQEVERVAVLLRLHKRVLMRTMPDLRPSKGIHIHSYKA